MREQYAYCLRSVTSSGSSISGLLVRACSGTLVDHPAASPALLVQRKELHICFLLAQPPLYLQHQLFLMGPAELAQKRAVLNPQQAIVQADVGDLCARTVVGDVVDQE